MCTARDGVVGTKGKMTDVGQFVFFRAVGEVKVG